MFMVVWLYVYWLYLHVCKNDEWRECRDQYIRVLSTFSVLTLSLDTCNGVTKSLVLELKIQRIKFFKGTVNVISSEPLIKELIHSSTI